MCSAATRYMYEVCIHGRRRAFRHKSNSESNIRSGTVEIRPCGESAMGISMGTTTGRSGTKLGGERYRAVPHLEVFSFSILVATPRSELAVSTTRGCIHYMEWLCPPYPCGYYFLPRSSTRRMGSKAIDQMEGAFHGGLSAQCLVILRTRTRK